MRALPLLVTLAVILSIATTTLASGSTASINLNANPVVSYSIVGNGYRENITIVNYTALMLQSIEYDIEHRIPLNQTQLEFLAFLQALSTQPTSKPSIVNVTIASTGAQPIGPYVSYEVFLINATLSSPAPTILYYPMFVYWSVNEYWLGEEQLPPAIAYLVALPGTEYAIAYITFIGTASVCVGKSDYYIYTPTVGVTFDGGFGIVNTTCTSSVQYVPVAMPININGVNYTLRFIPYNGASQTYPPLPPLTSATVFNVTAQAGSVVFYDVPLATPLSMPSITCPISRIGVISYTNLFGFCEGGGVWVPPVPPSYTVIVNPMFLSPTIYSTMPLIVVYPTKPGLYLLTNQYTIPPAYYRPLSLFVKIYANVTGPSVIPGEVFSISLPYGACGVYTISASLRLSGEATSYLAPIYGWSYAEGVWGSFSGWAAGYNTNEPSFASATVFVCDNRGFWALTPVTLNITLTDFYALSNVGDFPGYSVGYGIVTFEPNYYAWLAIVLVISAVGGGAYILAKRGGRGRGEVVIRL